MVAKGMFYERLTGVRFWLRKFKILFMNILAF